MIILGKDLPLATMIKDLLGALGYILAGCVVIAAIFFWRYVLYAAGAAVVVYGAYWFLNIGANSRRKA